MSLLPNVWPTAKPASYQRVIFWIGPGEYVGRYVPRGENDPNPFIADGRLYGRDCGPIEWYPIPEPARDRILAETADLRSFGYAPGRYFRLCCLCGGKFEGDKRAVTCLICAEKKSKSTITGDSETMENATNTTATPPVPPSIGRVVHYVLHAQDVNKPQNEGQHRAAIVTNAFGALG